MKTIQINRSALVNGVCDIEKMIACVIKTDLGAKNVRVSCKTRNWQGHTSPEFIAAADGIKLHVHGYVERYDLEVDPFNYPMDVEYYFAN